MYEYVLPKLEIELPINHLFQPLFKQFFEKSNCIPSPYRSKSSWVHTYIWPNQNPLSYWSENAAVLNIVLGSTYNPILLWDDYSIEKKIFILPFYVWLTTKFLLGQRVEGVLVE